MECMVGVTVLLPVKDLKAERSLLVPKTVALIYNNLGLLT
jgi:hypothetical protein